MQRSGKAPGKDVNQIWSKGRPVRKKNVKFDL